MVSIYQLLENLIDTIENSPAVPLCNNKVVNPDKVKKIINQALVELTGGMNSEAEQQIIASAKRKSQEIINQALIQAKEIELTAHRHAQSQTNESSILKAINIEANGIREKVRIETEQAYSLTEQQINQAEEEAKQAIENIITQAEHEAQDIKSKAVDYAQKIITEMESITGHSIELIQMHRERVNGIINGNNLDMAAVEQANSAGIAEPPPAIHVQPHYHQHKIK